MCGRLDDLQWRSTHRRGIFWNPAPQFAPNFGRAHRPALAQPLQQRRQPIVLDRLGAGDAQLGVMGGAGFLGVGQHDIAVSFDKLKWVNEPIRAAAWSRAPTSSRNATRSGPSRNSPRKVSRQALDR